MIDLNKKYWFYIFSNVYVAHQNNIMLLYNINDGQNIETDSEVCIKLIKDVYDSHNLGVATLTSDYLSDMDCLNFIDIIIEKGMGNIEEINDEQKPINLLPILNLQSDVDRLKKHEINLENENIFKYLTEINLFINNQCDKNCDYCSSFYKQTYACNSSAKENLNIAPDIIDNILHQTTVSLTKHVNILGGNILKYPYWEELFPSLKKYNYDIHLWIHYLNLSENINWLKELNDFNKEILISFPVHEESVQRILKLYGNGENTVFHFLIENEDQFDKVEYYIEVFDLKQTKIVPVFTGNNWNFFKENIFLQREDVLTVTTHQKIFCNQKLNSNFFGKLYFLPDGSVKASINSVEVGNIYKDKLLQVVLNEMNHNTAWRNIRSEEPCCNCLYQYLCPAPSNYENVMKKTNLCHVKP